MSNPLWNVLLRYPKPEDSTPPGTGKRRSGTNEFFLQLAGAMRGSHTLWSRAQEAASLSRVKEQSSALKVDLWGIHEAVKVGAMV